MINIYVIALTLVVLYVLDMLWKNLSLKNKIIEGFAGTADPATANITTSASNIVTKFSGDEASITPKLKASSISTTGDLDVGGRILKGGIEFTNSLPEDISVAKNLTVGGTSQFNDRVNFGSLLAGSKPININIMGRDSTFETEAISRFNNVVNIYDNLNVGSVEDPKDIILNGKTINEILATNTSGNFSTDITIPNDKLLTAGRATFNGDLTLNGNMNLTGTIRSNGKTINEIVAANTSGNFSTDVTIPNDKLLTAGKATFNDDITIVNTKGVNTAKINSNGTSLDISAGTINIGNNNLNSSFINIRTNQTTPILNRIAFNSENLLLSANSGITLNGSDVQIGRSPTTITTFRSPATFNDNIILKNDKELKIGSSAFKWDSANNKLVLTLPNNKTYEWSS